jgi:lysozyme
VKTNSAGLELIKKFEGLRLEAYLCPAKKWTIGYGHTSAAGEPNVVQGLKITEEEAEEILQRDLKQYEDAVKRLVKVDLNENQFSALVSFTYNLGAQNLAESTLLKLLNSGDYLGAAKQFPRWVKAGSQTLEGLVKRREAEQKLFESEVIQWKTKVATVFKREPKQSEELPESEKMSVSAGVELDVLAAGRIESENGLHYLITLNPKNPEMSGLVAKYNTWHVFHEHVSAPQTFWQPDQDEPVKEPKETNPTKLPPFIKLPGISKEVSVYQAVYSGSNFTWAELTKHGERIPVSQEITTRLVNLSKYMDGVREFLGNRPIIVTSGYRDPDTNRRVGGARNSRHTYGDAIDFYVQGESPVETFKKLKGYHKSGGLAVGNGFVHLDMRGTVARWRYPGGPVVELW